MQELARVDVQLVVDFAGILTSLVSLVIAVAAWRRAGRSVTPSPRPLSGGRRNYDSL